MDAYLRRHGLSNGAPDEDIIDLFMYGNGYQVIIDLIGRAECRTSPN